MIKKYVFTIIVSLIIVFSNNTAMSTDKYDEAIELCKNYSESLFSLEETTKEWEWCDKKPSSIMTSDVYENAMKTCDAADHRRYPITMWATYVGDMVDHDNYARLIFIELHHIAGDMVHIAKLAKDSTYREKIVSAIKEDIYETSAEEDVRNSTFFTTFKTPNMPKKRFNTDVDMCNDFITMMGFLKSWNELEKTDMENDALKDLYSQIRDGTSSLIKYREQRKLNLSGHPKNFTIEDTKAYKKTMENRIRLANYLAFIAWLAG